MPQSLLTLISDIFVRSHLRCTSAATYAAVPPFSPLMPKMIMVKALISRRRSATDDRLTLICCVHSPATACQHAVPPTTSIPITFCRSRARAAFARRACLSAPPDASLIYASFFTDDEQSGYGIHQRVDDARIECQLMRLSPPGHTLTHPW